MNNSELTNKKCPFCKSEIDINNMLCPNCDRVLIERITYNKNEINYNDQINNKKEEANYNPPVYKKNNFSKYLLITLSVGFLFWLFFVDTRENDYDRNLSKTSINKHTTPELVLNQTVGDFIIEDYTPVSFLEYYNSAEEPRDGEIITNDYGYIYLNQCANKNTNINFDKSKITQYTFNYKDKKFYYNLKLFDDLYQFTKNLKYQDCYFDDNYYDKMYFMDPYNNYFIESVSSDFIKLKENGYSKDEIVEIATIFTQSFPYGNIEVDEPNQYPYETFYKNSGNCLDKSVVLAGILKNLNYTAYILTTENGLHAFVGIVCDDGNIDYMGEELCFIETTYYSPIGDSLDLYDISEYYKVNNGSLIYTEENYGKNKSKNIDKIYNNINKIEDSIILIKNNLNDLQRKMCNTDCESCSFDYFGNYISSTYKDPCFNANEYNRYLYQYNENYKKSDNLFKELYEYYYSLEEAIFWNK